MHGPLNVKVVTLFKSHFRRNLVRYSNLHCSYNFYVTGLGSWGIQDLF
jgi:hypothetical protein